MLSKYKRLIIDIGSDKIWLRAFGLKKGKEKYLSEGFEQAHEGFFCRSDGTINDAPNLATTIHSAVKNGLSPKWRNKYGDFYGSLNAIFIYHADRDNNTAITEQTIKEAAKLLTMKPTAIIDYGLADFNREITPSEVYETFIEAPQ